MYPLVGWSLLTSVVVGYDAWAVLTKHDTMSKGFWKAVRNPVLRWFVVPAWLMLTVHLFFALP